MWGRYLYIYIFVKSTFHHNEYFHFESQNRLDRMLYVGLTEDHEESARLFAHMVGAQVLSQSGTLNLDIQEDAPTGTSTGIFLFLHSCISHVM
jgi:hypothetical protein